VGQGRAPMAVGSTWKMLAVLARRGPAHFFESGREVGTQDAQKRDKVHTAPWTHHTLKSQDRYEGCRRLPLNASAPLELEKGKERFVMLSAHGDGPKV
jgi:hypothetical protein